MPGLTDKTVNFFRTSQKTPLLDRRGGTNPDAPKVQTDELACRQAGAGVVVMENIICSIKLMVISTTPPRPIHFVHRSRHPSWTGGEFFVNLF